VRNLSIKLYRIYVCYMNIALYHAIYSVRYYPPFHVTTVGLGTYYLRIRGSSCIIKTYTDMHTWWHESKLKFLKRTCDFFFSLQEQFFAVSIFRWYMQTVWHPLLNTHNTSSHPMPDTVGQTPQVFLKNTSLLNHMRWCLCLVTCKHIYCTTMPATCGTYHSQEFLDIMLHKRV